MEKILIAEDEAVTASFLSKTLKSKGYLVTLTRTVKEALKEIEATHYDLVLFDIGLPDMKDTELIKTVREVDHDLIVVMITGNPKLDTSFDFVNSGADGCLVKPIMAIDLLDVIDELIHL
jgi:DNA-binding response OmpR family regulator